MVSFSFPFFGDLFHSTKHKIIRIIFLNAILFSHLKKKKEMLWECLLLFSSVSLQSNVSDT